MRGFQPKSKCPLPPPPPPMGFASRRPEFLLKADPHLSELAEAVERARRAKTPEAMVDALRSAEFFMRLVAETLPAGDEPHTEGGAA